MIYTGPKKISVVESGSYLYWNQEVIYNGNGKFSILKLTSLQQWSHAATEGGIKKLRIVALGDYIIESGSCLSWK